MSTIALTMLQGGCTVFPFHLLFDRRSTIVSVGSGLQAALQFADVITPAR